MNKYLTKVAELFAHATTSASLQNMLSGGGIKSVRHLSEENPDLKLSVEPLPIPILRKELAAKEAIRQMESLGKNPDKVFLTRGGYVPNYGDRVIVKELAHPQRRESFNTIPEEYTTRRRLSLTHNATVYVPDDEVDSYQKDHPEVAFKPISQIPVEKYGLMKRMTSYPGKLMERLGIQKLASLPVSLRAISHNAMVGGSEGLGIDLGDGSDVDVFVPYKRDASYESAIDRVKRLYPQLEERKSSLGKAYKTTLTGKINGKDVDVVLAKGEKAQAFKDAYLGAKSRLTDEDRERIRAEKLRLKNAWILPEFRYKRYKNQLAEDLGLKQHYF